MTLPQTTDAELVVRSQNGDAAAYDELKGRYADDVHRVALVAAPGEDQADDLVAETFTRFLALLRSGARRDGELRPYLRMVVRRLAMGRYQVEARATPPVDPFILQSLPAPDATATGADRRDLVRRAFEMLPADWQQVLWRTEVVGWTPAVLGAALHRPPAPVEALAFRAREGLRQAYFSVYTTVSARPGCRPFALMIPALSRGALTAPEESGINAHLGECGECRARFDEVLVLMSDLRTALVPALLGVQADATGAGAGRGELRRHQLRPSAPKLAGVLTAAAGLVAVAVITVAMMATMLSSPPAQQPTDPPAVAAPTDDSVTARTDLDEPGSTEEPTDQGDEDPEISALAPPPTPADPPEEAATERPADAPAAAQTPAAEPDQPAAGEPSGQTPAGSPAGEATDASPELPAEPATQPPDPDPTTAADQPGPPDANGNPAWLCDLVPSWPGCPDDPESPGPGAVCARIPDLPFCPAG